jgi:dTMP kinase
MAHHGTLITFEGIDGCGKSSLLSFIHQELANRGHELITTKEPGGTGLGKELREIIHAQKGAVCGLAEYLLFAADRAQHFQTLVIPALREGKIVLADRMADSSLAYQGYGRGLDKTMIASVNAWAMQEHKPDITLYVQIDVQTAFERLRARNLPLTSIEQEKTDFWQRVIDGYEAIFAQRSNVIIINGKQSQAAVQREALEKLIPILAKKS